ncbi:MAG TPA: helix-turn-helix domain-containing protein [Dissulfurispiraceae bacterium]|nr:helix-turn-helix domain-containing protein [Dissulfurispiraceae bacterium]
MNTLRDKVKELEREAIIEALIECGWIMAKAARQLGITERMIGYKIKKYGIRRSEERHESSRDLVIMQTTEKQA